MEGSRMKVQSSIIPPRFHTTRKSLSWGGSTPKRFGRRLKWCSQKKRSLSKVRRVGSKRIPSRPRRWTKVRSVKRKTSPPGSRQKQKVTSGFSRQAVVHLRHLCSEARSRPAHGFESRKRDRK